MVYDTVRLCTTLADRVSGLPHKDKRGNRIPNLRTPFTTVTAFAASDYQDLTRQPLVETECHFRRTHRSFLTRLTLCSSLTADHCSGDGYMTEQPI